MQIRALIEEKTGLRTELPPPEIEADLAIPCFDRKPQTVAEKLRNLTPLIKEIKIAGRYVNVILDSRRLAETVLPQIAREKENYGRGRAGADKTVIIEYSQPNIAKPLNVGHFRSTIIGQVLVNLYRWQGYRVIAINHLGDWGTQFGRLLVACHKWGAEEKDLFKLYVRFHAEEEKNPALADEARAMFHRLEQDDPKLLALWQKVVAESMKHFNAMYEELNISFDHITGESFYRTLAPAMAQEALDKGVAEKSGGAVIVPESKTGLSTFVIQKSDQSSIYAGRDLAAAKYRLQKWNPEKIIYIVGSEHNLYFKQIFKTLDLLGYDKNKFVHVSLGLVVLPEGKMSTRKGQVVFLEDLMREALEKTNGNKAIGYGALIYHALASNPEKTVVFQWDKLLSLTGASGPYLQYGYVRAHSILAKAPAPPVTVPDFSDLTNNDTKMVKLLARFPDVCAQAQQLNNPRLLVDYLNDLIREFNRFYETEPVLGAASSLRQSRLQIVAAVAQVIKNGLTLLTIKTPEKM